MRIHTNDFKNKSKSMGKEIDNIITYGSTTLHDELYSISRHYEASILKSVMKQLDIESSVDIPLGTVLNYQYGVKVGNAYEYLNYGNYVVYKSEKQEDTGTYKITCLDKILYSMKDYEAMNITYPITIRNYINAICNKLGLVFSNINDEFTNYNKEIQNELYLDSQGNSLGYTFRDVLDELAQVTASIICINEDTDELEVRYPNETNDIIDEEFLKDVNVKFGKVFGAVNVVTLSRSAGADNISYPSTLPQNPCEIKIVDNQIMNWNDRDEYLFNIYNRLYGMNYYINDFSSVGVMYYDLYDKYNIQIGEQTYNCIMLNDEINITSGVEELIHTDMPETTETDYTKSDKTDRKINQTYLIVDKQNQVIESVVTNVNTQNNKISQITQTVDELNQKIQDIADITIAGETTQASMILNGINESEPISVNVHPIGTNISYLYPRDNLYPSDTLFMTDRKIRFIRTYDDEGTIETENIDYELPDDLLYYDSNNYDEFILNYDTQTCQVRKKCKFNADGTVGLLATEVTTDYPYPQILLGDGDYEIQILGYNVGYLAVRLMAQNIYTSQFATKVEVSSEISQTAQEINLEVSKKVGNDEVISKINQSAEAIQINANKISLARKTNKLNWR